MNAIAFNVLCRHRMHDRLKLHGSVNTMGRENKNGEWVTIARDQRGCTRPSTDCIIIIIMHLCGVSFRLRDACVVCVVPLCDIFLKFHFVVVWFTRSIHLS